MLDIKLILQTVRILLKKESTEGFDKAEELERRKQEILDKCSDNLETEKDLTGVGN